ncbi:MAG: universal stress protein [Desulfobaccales bacterium]
MFKKFLLAYDGSDDARKALEAGIKLAKLHQAELLALAVLDKPPGFAGSMDKKVVKEKDPGYQHCEQFLDEAQKQAHKAGVELKTEIGMGHPAMTIVEVAAAGKFDLVLVGHAGLSQVFRSLLGTTAEKVARHAPCTVIIVR